MVNALITNAMKQKLISERDAEAEDKDDLLAELLAVRDYARESIEEGLTGN